MTTISAPDTQNLEQFLIWFTSQERIPLKTRRDFLAHVMEKDKIDEYSAKFIDKTLDYLVHQDEKSQKYWESELLMWESIAKAEANPETSLTEKDYREAESEIQNLTDEFVTDYKEAESEANQVAETSEKSREISEVDALKASLNL